MLWLPIAEFACNNHPLETTWTSPFFANYGFNLRMDFSMDPQDVPEGSTYKRAERQRATDLAEKMESIWEHLADETRLA